MKKLLLILFFLIVATQLCYADTTGAVTLLVPWKIQPNGPVGDSAYCGYGINKDPNKGIYIELYVLFPPESVSSTLDNRYRFYKNADPAYFNEIKEMAEQMGKFWYNAYTVGSVGAYTIGYYLGTINYSFSGIAGTERIITSIAIRQTYM